MRNFTIFLKVVLILFLLATCIIWFAANGSGHNIPLKTNVKFGVVSGVLLGLLISVVYLSKKVNKNQS